MLIRLLIASLIAALTVAAGCSPARRLDLASAAGGNAALFHQVAAFDGKTGSSLTFAQMARRCKSADVVLFGELHSDPVCNQTEAQLLYALASSARPIALAMEFFETDTQSAIDAYFSGRIDEAAFVKQSRQGRDYPVSHRPLIELCRAADLPVIAANTPRKLLRTFRESNLPYVQFRATLPRDDQRCLPATSEFVGGRYYERWREAMRDHPPSSAPASGPASRPTSSPAMAHTSGPERGFLTQLLWDSTMSDWVARARTENSRQRIMLVVGCFHVEQNGATAAKLRQRRPDDRIVTVVYRSSPIGPFAFAEKDRGAADIILYGVARTEKPAS